jgi:hypothetical protein
MDAGALFTAALAPVDQDYLLEARQMQAAGETLWLRPVEASTPRPSRYAPDLYPYGLSQQGSG